jgi:hypothetical protein
VYWLGVLGSACAALASHGAATELQVTFYGPLLLGLATTAAVVGSAFAYGLVRRAPERALLAAWGCTVVASAAAWHVLDGLGTPGARLAPIVGLLAIAGHAAGLGALALPRPHTIVRDGET